MVLHPIPSTLQAAELGRAGEREKTDFILLALLVPQVHGHNRQSYELQLSELNAGVWGKTGCRHRMKKAVWSVHLWRSPVLDTPQREPVFCLELCYLDLSGYHQTQERRQSGTPVPSQPPPAASLSVNPSAGLHIRPQPRAATSRSRLVNWP